MISLNKVEILGNLTRDPELKYTRNNMAMAKVGIAVNRSWKNQAGEWQEKVTFLDITFWGKTAERVAQLKKGDKVFIDGRLEKSEWTTPQGEKRSELGITGRDFFGSYTGVRPTQVDEAGEEMVNQAEVATNVEEKKTTKKVVEEEPELNIPEPDEPLPF